MRRVFQWFSLPNRMRLISNERIYYLECTKNFMSKMKTLQKQGEIEKCEPDIGHNTGETPTSSPSDHVRHAPLADTPGNQTEISPGDTYHYHHLQNPHQGPESWHRRHRPMASAPVRGECGGGGWKRKQNGGEERRMRKTRMMASRGRRRWKAEEWRWWSGRARCRRAAQPPT